MKVKELVEKLLEYPKELDVYMKAFCDEESEGCPIKEITVHLVSYGPTNSLAINRVFLLSDKPLDKEITDSTKIESYDSSKVKPSDGDLYINGRKADIDKFKRLMGENLTKENQMNAKLIEFTEKQMDIIMYALRERQIVVLKEATTAKSYIQDACVYESENIDQIINKIKG